jgi:hypothetical protein
MDILTMDMDMDTHTMDIHIDAINIESFAVNSAKLLLYFDYFFHKHLGNIGLFDKIKLFPLSRINNWR